MIKSTRKKKCLTQLQLSNMTNLSQSYISRLEKTDFVHSPTITQIIAISKVLDLDPVILAKYFIRKEENK
ncbi:helix-turn-helix transcriptional regulator [Romboutsia sp.]|uniref:helix-turn-helix domain-containing protein n=1 Tax=Romboutsia sp. TaxID=1965302 RepID=UPI002B5E8C78|nr:helix-turn-helix transcriptional regulator [Romboutsia sp.]HSQ88708.1 helix-turn-helix transcriptional regulator [Romboutsia sp.]